MRVEVTGRELARILRKQVSPAITKQRVDKAKALWASMFEPANDPVKGDSFKRVAESDFADYKSVMRIAMVLSDSLGDTKFTVEIEE
jgi:hypothetical protein